MSTEYFHITEHVIPSCHIREYPGSTVDQEAVLQLHVKQYTPKHQTEPIPADAMTIIATHGVSLYKELYEPLWDELLAQSTRHRFHIRSIWIADNTNMGVSGVLNEDKLSTDCSWMDHSRDLLLLINHFRDQMPRPLVGIGHSYGGCIITNLAYIHPRLFITLLLLDPVLQTSLFPMGFGTDATGHPNFSLWRQDVWPTRAAASQAHRALLRSWDPRCADRMIQYAFCDLPTPLYPNTHAAKDTTTNPTDTPVTLTTTKHQDVRAGRSRSHHACGPGNPDFLHPSVPEPLSAYYRLPTLRPSCLWVLAAKTYLRLDEMREGIRTCGSGVGGSGGVSQGRVKEVTLSGSGHLFPFQEVGRSAETCAAWLETEMERYRMAENEW
ncbi:hypothetical protein BO78DRAFT_410128 [Aspergillus sclerotiicarbonarius CBS 121057]|uniref:AB hydrolase-1 domain-containing protein n=1 Tax=Aspergillus sclerotiicarbonarius (strain CBS 121057 / IBT 28362) TaxID=1448318 RepID=A0A319DZ77_ASPSB|nr:hypothetical protein BO78DRAFT_410128 [Aspergillus sclerotiicarbonarius CBS 121057]